MIGLRNDHVEDRLAAYCDAALPDAEAREVRAHLERCARCRSAYGEIRDGHRAAGALGIVAMPKERAEAVRARLREAFVESRDERTGRWRWMGAAAALLLAFGLGVVAALRYLAPGPVLKETVAASSFEAAARGLHVALAGGREALDLVTDSPADARRFLRERAGVDASIAETRPVADGDRYRVVGVRLVRVGDAEAGAIVYEIDGHRVTLLVARDEDVPDAPRWSLAGKRVDVRRDDDPVTGLTTLTWRNSGNAYTLVSDLPDSGRESCFVCHTTDDRRRQILAAPLTP